MSQVTRILNAIDRGDESASEELLPLVYQELRRLAALRLAGERAANSLQPTMLVHDAYVRLVDGNEKQSWKGRGHFFAAAAEAMRRLLIENARKRKRLKHGGEFHRVELVDLLDDAGSDDVDLLALDEALEKLEHRSPRSAALVKLRFFAGLSVREAAATMGIAPSTVVSDWAYAKGWLGLELSGSSQS